MSSRQIGCSIVLKKEKTVWCCSSASGYSACWRWRHRFGFSARTTSYQYAMQSLKKWRLACVARAISHLFRAASPEISSLHHSLTPQPTHKPIVLVMTHMLYVHVVVHDGPTLSIYTGRTIHALLLCAESGTASAKGGRQAGRCAPGRRLPLRVSSEKVIF